MSVVSTTRPAVTHPGHRARQLGLWLAVALIVVWSVFPFLWQSNASLQPDRNLVRSAPKWLPLPGTLEHYRNVFTVKHFQDYIFNSIIVAVSSTLVALVLAAVCIQPSNSDGVDVLRSGDAGRFGRVGCGLTAPGVVGSSGACPGGDVSR